MSDFYPDPVLSQFELIVDYEPGGYCPVKIGDVFSDGTDTYTVLHRLGFGSSSAAGPTAFCDTAGQQPDLLRLACTFGDWHTQGTGFLSIFSSYISFRKK
jgi:hypothetical protein